MHIPVLSHEVIDLLDLEPGMVVVDATAGGGGHSKEILKRILPGGKLIAIDRDIEAVTRIKTLFSENKENVHIINRNFSSINSILADLSIKKINGALFDLGVSSYQIDSADRGFSFMEDGPLDMRFDPEGTISAYEIVNSFSREELIDIIRTYGEERHAKLVTGAIINARKKKRIKTTLELAEIIKQAVGNKYYKQKLHPAVRTFQGLRIFVNDELNSIKKALEDTIDLLDKKARISVISFHSLEDRIVKNIFRDKGRAGVLNVLTKKPIRPTREEIKNNYRSRSAKLRVSEKI